MINTDTLIDITQYLNQQEQQQATQQNPIYLSDDKVKANYFNY